MSFPSLTRRTLALLAVLEPLAALFIADMARTGMCGQANG